MPVDDHGHVIQEKEIIQIHGNSSLHNSIEHTQVQVQGAKV